MAAAAETETETKTKGSQPPQQSSSTSSSSGSCQDSTDAGEGECSNPDVTNNNDDNKSTKTPGRPVVTKEELAKHVGTPKEEKGTTADEDAKDETATNTATNDTPTSIWLSVLGEVYDVTAGEQYYGHGMSYGAFAGTDCSVCYVTGTFTPEEAEKPLSEITDKLLGGILEWKNFYETHETYKYVGRLIDPRFFDEDGEPTPSMREFAQRVLVYQVEAAEKKKVRDEQRRKRDAERKAKAQARSTTTTTTTTSKTNSINNKPKKKIVPSSLNSN